MQPPVLYEQHVPAVGAALLVKHTFGTGGINGHVGHHRVGLTARFDGGADAHLGGIGIVGERLPVAAQVGPEPRQRFEDVQIRQW